MRIPRKLLALAVGVGLLAVMAVGASSASAEGPGIFECEQYTCFSEGTNTNTHEFTTNSGTVKCTTATFTDELTAASTWVKAQAVYSNCKFKIGMVEPEATVNMGSCEYEFHAGEHISATEHRGTVDVINKPGENCAASPITITAGTCVVTVSSQTGRGPIKYVNEGAGATRHVIVTSEIQGEAANRITYTASGCPAGNGTFSNGEYTGAADVKGYTDQAHTTQQGIWVN